LVRDRRLRFGGLRLSSWRGSGIPEPVVGWIEGGPAAAQPLGGLVLVGVEELLELLGGQRANRQAAAFIDRRAHLL
jgi:hypothetical protein